MTYNFRSCKNTTHSQSVLMNLQSFDFETRKSQTFYILDESQRPYTSTKRCAVRWAGYFISIKYFLNDLLCARSWNDQWWDVMCLELKMFRNTCPDLISVVCDPEPNLAPYSIKILTFLDFPLSNYTAIVILLSHWAVLQSQCRLMLKL